MSPIVLDRDKSYTNESPSGPRLLRNLENSGPLEGGIKANLLSFHDGMGDIIVALLSKGCPGFRLDGKEVLSQARYHAI